MLLLGNRFSTGSLRPESLARLTIPVNMLLIILLAHSLARLTWSLIPQSTLSTAIGENTAPAASDATAIDDVDYNAIASWHLFGQSNESQPAPKPTIKVPETRLKLKLFGIFYSEDGRTARALIAEDGSAERSYTPGDALTGGVRLEQVLPDKVILSRNGQLEMLSLPIDSNSTGGARSALQQSPSYQPSAATTPGAGNTIDAGAIANQLREAAVTRPDALQDLAHATPHTENGQIVGFRLRPGRNRQMLAKLGLRSGDILTEVNGIQLNSPTQGMAALQEIMQARQINARVLRNGTEIPFTFQLE